MHIKETENNDKTKSDFNCVTISTEVSGTVCQYVKVYNFQNFMTYLLIVCFKTWNFCFYIHFFHLGQNVS